MPTSMPTSRPLLVLLTAAALGASAFAPVPLSDVDRPTVYDANADGVQDGAASAVEAPVYAEWQWAPAATAPIHPGTETVTAGAQCTANFVFVRTVDVEDVTYLVDVLLGTAAHCISSASGADECKDTGRPIGTATTVDGATRPAAAAYNATISMQRVGETDPNTCRHNDFGLIRLAFADWSRVNPSIPDFGGPVGTNTTGTARGRDVWSWGNSSLRLGIEQTSPKKGVGLATDSGGWNHSVYTLSQGIPGDSGSALLDESGRALGVLSTISLLGGSNNADDIGRAVAWAVTNEPTMAGLRLEHGTEPFSGAGWPFLP